MRAPTRWPGWLLGTVGVLALAGCSLLDDDQADAAATLDVGAGEVAAVFDENGDCFGIEPVGLDPGELECGTVEAPLDYQNPDQGTLELAVAVLPGSHPGQHEQPVLLLGGGPGEVLIEPMLTRPRFRGLFEVGPDLIVMDQRGVGSSEPELACPEVPAIESQATAQHDVDATLAALGRCRARLVDDVDLDAYNHVANAHDVELVRRALGHQRIDVRGGSYGAHLALHAAKRHPEGIRSLILSSPVDPSRNFVTGIAGGFDRALGRLGDACAADTDCALAIGDLQAAISDTVRRLAEQPQEVTVQPPGGKRDTITYNPTTFMNGLFLLFYLPDGVAVLPAMVDLARDGHLEPLAQVVAQVEQQLQGAVAIGMQTSMVCSGEGAHFSPQAALDRVDSELVAQHWFPFHPVGGEPTSALCAAWDVEPAFDPDGMAVDVDVPTLLITGTFDHVTPPDLGTDLAEKLPTAHVVEVPTAGHAPLEALTLTSPPCGAQLIGDFLADPTSAPDDSCAHELELQLRTELPGLPRGGAEAR